MSDFSKFYFKAKGSEFAILTVKNIFLTLVTFGFYFPWARVEVRKYLGNHSSFEDQRFEYTGTGKQLFIALLFSWLLLLIALVIYFVVKTFIPSYFATLIAWGLYFCLVPFFTYGARRFLAMNIKHRGLHFYVRNKEKGKYVRSSIVGIILSILTLGIYRPFVIVKLKKILWNNTFYGNRNFKYNGDGVKLFYIVLKGVFFSAITFGIYNFWMRAEILRYHTQNISFDNSRFYSILSGGDLLLLELSNLLLLILTLGLAFPWVYIRSRQAYVNSIYYDGKVDFESLSKFEEEDKNNKFEDIFSNLCGLEVEI